MRVEEAFDVCEEITYREAKNFAYGIRLLRPPERRALSSVYAMARRIDDIGDGELEPPDKLDALATARMALHELGPESEDPVLVALWDSAQRYALPIAAFDELIDGCEMDVVGSCYHSFDELVVYCRRVAGSIGRLSLAVFGAEGPQCTALADDLGVALQLVNILRDVKEDAARGRRYLPAEDAEVVGCAPDLVATPEQLAALVGYEAERAQAWLDHGLGLLPYLDRRSRACVGAMAGIYGRLLVHIRRDPMAVTRGRLSISAGEKIAVALRAMATSAAGAPPRAERSVMGKAS